MMIRKAMPGDEADIGRIQITGWQFSYRGIYSDDYLASLSIAEKIEMWERLIRENPEEKSIFVALKSDKITAFISVFPWRNEHATPEDGEVSALYVDPALQGSGTGSALLHHVLEWYRTRGIKNVFVQTLDKSAYKNFYPKNGGVLCPEKIKRTFKDGQTLDLVEYKWEL